MFFLPGVSAFGSHAAVYRERELFFLYPTFHHPYSSLKAPYNRLPILSPQQTPCEVGGAERALRELCDWLKVTQLAACGGVGNQTQFSRLESTAL